MILVLALIVAAPDATRASALFDEGNAAFLAGETVRAIAAYEALLSEGVASPELETNLAAAYFRQGKRGPAALHLERALYLDPADEDARADLIEIRRGNVDKLQGEAQDGEALSRALAPLPGRGGAIAFVGFWTLAWGLLAAHVLRPRALVLAVALAAGGFALAAGAVATGAAAWHRIALRRAVVVAASAPAREGPGERTTAQFEVHEGTALSVEDEAQGFRRVKLANGLSGWVPSAAVELVVPRGWSGTKG